MAEKAIERVLNAVQAGHELSSAIAQYAHVHPNTTVELLRVLTEGGHVVREPIVNHRRGRPSYRYRFFRPISANISAVCST
jgi:predicted ArsR family transcriptional regulator